MGRRRRRLKDDVHRSVHSVHNVITEFCSRSPSSGFRACEGRVKVTSPSLSPSAFPASKKKTFSWEGHPISQFDHHEAQSFLTSSSIFSTVKASASFLECSSLDSSSLTCQRSFSSMSTSTANLLLLTADAMEDQRVSEGEVNASKHYTQDAVCLHSRTLVWRFD